MNFYDIYYILVFFYAPVLLVIEHECVDYSGVVG